MTISEILSGLTREHRSGNGWIARCPAHEDKKSSLSVAESGGKILLNCFAGCEPEAVVAALGLRMSDLFIDSRTNGNSGPHGQIKALYDYTDEAGKLLFQVVRYEPKDFKQRRPDGRNGWIWNLSGLRRVLYRLPEVLKSKSVLICEGEKDCETARKLGLTATTNACGSKAAWLPDYTECLRAKRVCVIGDADAPGLAHAREVARSLLGVAASVRLIERLPGGVKDLTDFVEGGSTREAFLKIIKLTPELKTEDVKAWTVTNHMPCDRFNLTLLGDLMREPEEAVSWLLGGILPSGGLSLLAAKPKTGKSTLARCLALAVARGEEYLGRATLPGPVIYLALEEKRSEVKKHFADLGAEGTELVHVHCAAAPQDAIPALLEEVKKLKPVLVIVDPILRMTRLRDANDYALVSNALEPLMSLAREYGAHLLLVYHLGKGERSEATDAILGSTAFFAAVDTALIMKKTEKYRTLQSRQRYGEDLPETVIEYDPERRAVSLGAERLEAEALTVSEEILKFLEGAGEGKAEPEIDENVDGKTTVKRKALRELVEKGKVARHGGGKKGDPYTYSKCLFPCSPYIPGTREQEFEKAPDTPVNIERILVPASEEESILVPENREVEKGVAVTAPKTRIEEGEI